MSTAACAKHPLSPRTAPNRNDVTFCLSCVARNYERNPAAFAVTESFKRELRQVLTALPRRRVVI